jgi:hypothetical protein
MEVKQFVKILWFWNPRLSPLNSTYYNPGMWKCLLVLTLKYNYTCLLHSAAIYGLPNKNRARFQGNIGNMRKCVKCLCIEFLLSINGNSSVSNLSGRKLLFSFRPEQLSFRHRCALLCSSCHPSLLCSSTEIKQPERKASYSFCLMVRFREFPPRHPIHLYIVYR